jgi:hypothetical protein
MTPKLQLQAFVTKIIHANPGVIAGDEDLYIAIWIIWRECHRPNTSDLASFGVLAT